MTNGNNPRKKEFFGSWFWFIKWGRHGRVDLFMVDIVCAGAITVEAES